MSKLMNRPPPNIMPPSQPPNAASVNSQTFVDKIVVGLDHAPQQFDLRGQLIGAGGANLHYIRNETGAIATLRGRGSMFIDLALGTESPEPLHLYIEHSRYDGLQSAKQLANNLIETLQQELVLYHQLNPPTAPNGSIFHAPPTHPPPPTPTAPQMSVPPPMLAHPPPAILPTHQPPATAQSVASILPNAQIPPPTHANLVQHHALVPQSVPVHLNPANMIIQQQITPVPAINNVNIPPPNLQIKPTQMLHLHAPPPNQIQLTQPPPNIQMHQASTNTQILLNQPQPSYQYQYIQQAPDANAGNPNQITVQHIYQQPIQGMVQSNQSHQPQFNAFAQPVQVQRQTQHMQTTPQYFVQGNSTFLVPPPNMLQSGTQAQQNIIFQTQAPPPQIQMQHIQQIQTSVQQQSQLNNQIESAAKVKDPPIKEENQETPERETSPSKEVEADTKNEEPSNGDAQNGAEQDEPSTVNQNIQQISVESAATQLMSVPPPITCVQHIVGNTLITTAANQSQSHKIFNQIPVSIQQIPAPQQQIHVSTANGQHFLVQAQHWAQSATQFQPVSQAGNIQGFHLTQGITNDLQSNQPPQQQQILSAAFNQHQLQTPTGMQVQFQQIHPAQSPHLIQQIPAGSVAHLIEQPPPTIQTSQMHIHSMPPTFSVSGLPPPTPLLDTMVNQARQGASFQQKATSYSGSKTNIVDTQLRIGQKRKMDEDAAQRALSRSGIGNHSNAASIMTTTPISTTTSSTASHTSSSNVQDESNQGTDPYQSGDSNSSSLYDSHTSSKQPSLMHGVPPPAGGAHRNHFKPSDASGYGADTCNSSGGGGGMQQRPMRYPFDGPMLPGGAPPRYRQMAHRGEFSYPMRPPPPPMHMQDASFPMHRMNFRPPPPPPPYGPPPSHFTQW